MSGHKFWLERASYEANTIYKDPDKLFKACQEYFESVENNPLQEEKLGWHEGIPKKTNIKKKRPFTKTGLALFLGTTHKSLIVWYNDRHDLKPVLEWAFSVIETQKFEGAAAGFFNALIISRDLGLVDKQEIEAKIPGMTINPPEGEAPEEPPVHGE